MPLSRWRESPSGLIVPAGLYTGRVIVAQHGPALISQASRVETRRRRASKSHERLRRRVEARGVRILLRLYGRIIADAARRTRRLERRVDVDAALSIDRYQADFEALFLRWGFHAAAQGVALERSWIRSAAPNASRQWATSGLWVQAAAGDDLPDITVEMPDRMARGIRGWLGRRSKQAWNGVKAALRKVIGREIADGLKDGDSIPDLAKRIRKEAPNKTRWQATMIARTESTAAMNHGQQAEREDAEIEWKEWVSTLDSRTRSAADGDAFDHLAPDGQVVRNDQPFIVSGQKLMFPGDGTRGASAGNIVNCRCSSVSAWPDDPLDTVHRPDPVPPAPAETAPAPVREPQPPKINHHGKTSDAFRREVDHAVTSLPRRARERLEEHGVTVEAGRMLPDVRPELKGEHPRGWPEGTTWDNVDGAWISRDKQAVVSQFYVEEGVLVESTQTAGVVRHELGHAYDEAVDMVSSKDFLDAYVVDLDRLDGLDVEDRESLRSDLAYFFQKGRDGRSEVIAEAFAIVTGGGALPDRMTTAFQRVFAESIRHIQRGLDL